MHHNIHQFILLYSILFGNFYVQKHILFKIKTLYKVTKILKAGDTVVLKDGIWSDFEILFKGEGTKKT